MVNMKRASEVIEYGKEYGKQAACEHFNITNETYRRYKRMLNNNKDNNKDFEIPENNQKDRLIRDILDRYSVEELKTIANGTTIRPETPHIINFDGERLKIGIIADTHFGSKYFRNDWYEAALREFDKQNVEFIIHGGDITEGMSNRPGHIYELTHLGYEAQKEYAIEKFQQANRKIYFIDGNHDRWYIKSNGALIARDIERACENAEFIGHDQGTININEVAIDVWHGEDGSSYALSYRIQKIIETYAEKRVPDALFTAHVHKAIYLPCEREVQAFGMGCLQSQTQWMRGKRLAAHCGFWIVEFHLTETEIKSCWCGFHPLYG